MRALLALLVAPVIGAAAVAQASAQTSDQAAAEASIVAGDLGAIGHLRAVDDERGSDRGETTRPGITIAAGSASARATRSTATASAQARDVSLFDGLVTVETVERAASAARGGVSYSGAVTGLTLGGQPEGDVSEAASFRVPGARVTVNRGATGLRVELTRARAGFPAGTTVQVATLRVTVPEVPAAVTAPPATPSPTATATPTQPADADADADPARQAKRGRSQTARLAGGRFVFPVYGDARVADDFGAARQIGAHQGNDVFAPFGAPVLAVAAGTIEKVGTLPISGNRLWLRTDRGDTFFYAHLSAFAPAAVNGQPVKAGTLLGFTGNTGDAEPTPPHVHFEIHPGDGDAIDPHRVLAAWRERGEIPSGGWLARYGTDTAERPGALVELRDLIAGE